MTSLLYNVTDTLGEAIAGPLVQGVSSGLISLSLEYVSAVGPAFRTKEGFDLGPITLGSATVVAIATGAGAYIAETIELASKIYSTTKERQYLEKLAIDTGTSGLIALGIGIAVNKGIDKISYSNFALSTIGGVMVRSAVFMSSKGNVTVKAKNPADIPIPYRINGGRF
jgi:hypothetical protein